VRVAIIAPNLEAEGTFYRRLVQFMQVGAEQLGVELEVLDCMEEKDRGVEQASQLASSPTRPDYLMVTNARGEAKRQLEIATKAGIDVFVVCDGLGFSEKAVVGAPRAKNPHFIGELLPDDEGAGFLLADTLLKRAEAKGLGGAGGKLHVGGLGGALAGVAVLRANGLHRAVARQGASLTLVAAGWSQDEGAQSTAELLQHDPDLNVVWAVNDDVALGAVRTLKAHGREPGKDVLVGGIDWDPRALQEIKRGLITVSIGGHVTDGLWALLLLYDHHHGHDFVKLRQHSSWGVAEPGSAGSLLKLFELGGLRQVDLRRFSRAESSPGEPLELSVNSLLPML